MRRRLRRQWWMHAMFNWILPVAMIIFTAMLIVLAAHIESQGAEKLTAKGRADFATEMTKDIGSEMDKVCTVYHTVTGPGNYYLMAFATDPNCFRAARDTYRDDVETRKGAKEMGFAVIFVCHSSGYCESFKLGGLK